jgi:hypothetical protein
MARASSDTERKRFLLDTWMERHARDHTAPLFAIPTDQSRLSLEAEELLGRVDRAGKLALYIVCLPHSTGGLIPVYIGKATSALDRWKNGHFPKLRQVRRRGVGSYRRWLDVLDAAEGPIMLVCLSEAALVSAPIPGFPCTVGVVEYQLVTLAAATYRDTLLNSEGVPR